MGLDIVELIMDVEDAFKISILDTETCATVGELNAMINKKLQGKLEPGICPNVVFALRFRMAWWPQPESSATVLS